MPSLKDLKCSIELSNDEEPLRELGTVYGDACVETFIPVPKRQQNFTVHLSSKDFIAPGIAMYVFIDGIYQCNRNRQNMKLRQPADRRSLVDFKVRQKEEKQKNGLIIAREWTFEKLDHASADGAPVSCSPHILENIGCIEVVILRCAGPRHTKTATNINLDGATDYPDYRFDRDSRSRTTAYDDRNPFVSSISNRDGPPPPASSYQPPYAETVHSREGPATQYRSSNDRRKSPFRINTTSKPAYFQDSEPVSPGTRPPRGIQAPAFQYGSGPLPPQSRMEPQRVAKGEAMPSGIPVETPIVDSVMLEKIVTDDVKRGVEESRNKVTPAQSRVDSRRYQHEVDDPSQIPGAWPTSPTHPGHYRSLRSVPSTHRDRDHDRHGDESAWGQDSIVRKNHHTRSRAGTRVSWNKEQGWDKRSRVDKWGSQDDNPAGSWDTQETWSKKRPDGWEEVRRRSGSKSRRSIRNPPPSRKVSRAPDRNSNRHRSRQGQSHQSRSRSHWREDLKSSSEDNDGWTQIEAPSDSTTSLERSDSTLKPSHSRSQVQTPRSKSMRWSSQRVPSRSNHERAPNQRIETPQWHSESAYHARPPSVLVTNAPDMISAPVPNHPIDVRSRQQSIFTQPTASIVAPPPTWGCAGSGGARKKSSASTYVPPAPFSTIGEKRQESRQSSGSSSWEVTSKAASKGKPQQSTWGRDFDSDKAKSVWGDADNKTVNGDNDHANSWGNNDTTDLKDNGWEDQRGDGDGWGATTKMEAMSKYDWANNNKNDDSWGQLDSKDAAVDGWNTDNKGDTWIQTKASSKEKNDPTGIEGFDASKDTWGVADDTSATWDQQKDITNESPFTADAGDLWAAPAASVAPEQAKPPSTLKRHTSKSLSKYRQHSPPTLSAKPYWQFPPAMSNKILRPTVQDHTTETSDKLPHIPAESLHAIPRAAAEKKRIQHQVLAGPGAQYGHAISRPEYLDSLDKPYAVFRFKYRSRDMLRDMFGQDCLSTRMTGRSVPREKEELRGLPREQLLERMVELQRRLANKDNEGESCAKEVTRDLTEKWVERHSRPVSEQGREKGKVEKAESAANKSPAWKGEPETWANAKW